MLLWGFGNAINSRTTNRWKTSGMKFSRSFPEERAGSGLGVSSKTFTCFKLNKYYL